MTTPAPTEDFSIVMLATHHIDYYAERTKASWQAYCDKHGYNFIVYEDKILDDMHINWSRIEAVRLELEKRTSDWVVLVDADTLIVNDSIKMEDLITRYGNKDILFSSDVSWRFGINIPLNFQAAFKYGARLLPNGGFFMIRNEAYGRQFITDWLDLARGDLKHLADKHPRCQNVLWTGLFPEHKKNIGMIKEEVLRVGINNFLDPLTIRMENALALHDKQLTIKPT
ncbi:MAG: hypothetical protein CMF31_07785 [Kordiimonas sp.]|nr:hypothetical protein [Kordiimonas sp.]|tara:strand:- start:1504 stop:2184 length:681 start_codon:yes stop_codon:yes gene_type:complete